MDNRDKGYYLMINPFIFHKFTSLTIPWATLFTTVDTPNPVAFVTNMPVGEKLLIDFSDGPAGRYEVVGNGANQTTQHTYDVPVPGTKITITGFSGNQVLMRYFSIAYQYLNGDCPIFEGFADIQTIYLRNNSFTGAFPPVTGCDALRYLYLRLTPFTGQCPAVSGLSDLQQVYADQGEGFTGNIPSLTGLPDLSMFQIGDNLITGFEGGFTPAAQRTTSISLRAYNNYLTSSAVNLILADARTAEFGTGDNIEVDRNNNEPPTGQGLIDKQWLIDNGATVSTN